MSDASTISSDEINLESRPVELVVYGLGTIKEVHTTWLRPNSTYGEIRNQLAAWDDTRSYTVLLGNYGPIPHWTESDPELLVGDTCRILYAIAGNETTHYVLGVVRTSEMDYPIPIYDLTQNSTITVSQAIVAAQPDLAGKIKSITRFIGSEPMEDTRYDDEVALRSNQPPGVPTVFIITLSEVTAIFQTELVEGSIPPFLRVPYVHCGHLLRRAYALDAFSMQMIHLSSAILHLICSMAANLQPTITKNVAEMTPIYSADDKMSKLLSVAPLLAQELQLLLEDMEKIINGLGKDGIDQGEIQSEVDKLFIALCRDYPGATTVRHSYRRFEKMASIDGEETLQSNQQQLVHTPATSRSAPSPSSYPPPTSAFAKQNYEMAHTLHAFMFLDNTPGMGQGYRASKYIERGTVILQERPTLLLRANLLPQQRNAAIEHALQHLPAGARQKFSELQVSYRFGIYAANVGRFLANALPCEDNTHSAGLFMEGARFNSSCTPNVHHHWNGRHMEFRAIVNIYPQQELFICYSIRDLLFPRSERRKNIEKSYRFECQCFRCLEHSQESDERRLRIGEALRITNHADCRFARHNLNMIIDALRDLQEEGLCHYCDILLYDGHQVCVAAGDGNNAMLWLRKAFEVAVGLVGEHNSLVHEIGGLIATLSPDQIYFHNWVQLQPPPE